MSIDDIPKNSKYQSRIDAAFNEFTCRVYLESGGLPNIINWTQVSAEQLSIEFIKDFNHYLDLKVMIETNRISMDDLDDAYDLWIKCDSDMWKIISRKKTLSNEFIHRHASNLNWKAVVRNNCKSCSVDFLTEFSDYIPWRTLETSWTLSDDVLEKFIDQIDLDRYMKNSQLRYEFINAHADKLNWNQLVKCQILTDNMIIAHMDKIHLPDIRNFAAVSEQFIKDHFDNLSWDAIQKTAIMSGDFWREHFSMIDIHAFGRNGSVPTDVYLEYVRHRD